MNNTIEIAKIAANHAILKQAIASNNLANLSTPGFKSQLRYLLNTVSNKDNTPTSIPDSFQYDLSKGVIKHTEKPLDIALSDHYWLVLRDNQHQDYYTRNGHLEVNDQGELMTQGLHVTDQEGKPMQIPINSIPSIDDRGILTVLIKNDNNDETNLEIGQIKTTYIEDNYLYKHSNGLFRLLDNSTEICSRAMQNDDTIKIIQGALEESNVNPTANIIDMINNTRQFDMEMKMITNCNNNEQEANSMLNINN